MAQQTDLARHAWPVLACGKAQLADSGPSRTWSGRVGSLKAGPGPRDVDHDAVRIADLCLEMDALRRLGRPLIDWLDLHGLEVVKHLVGVFHHEAHVVDANER